MSLKKSTFSGVAWLFFSNSANQILTFTVFIILARHLELSDFGHVMLSVLIINLFTMFFKEGVVEYLVQSTSWSERAASTAFWIMACVGIGLTAILAFEVGPALQAYYGGDIAAYIGAMSPVILLGCFSVVNLALVRRHFRFRTSALRNFTNGFLTGAVAVVMALCGYGAWSLVLSRVVGAVGGALILWLQEPYRPRFMASFSDMTSIVRYSIPILMTRLVNELTAKSPELLLSALIGPAGLAIYRVGARIIDTLNLLLLDPIIHVLLTTFARAKTRTDGANWAFSRVAGPLAALLMPIYIGTAAIAPQLTLVLYGRKWEESGWVTLMLGLQIVPSLVRSMIGIVYRSSGIVGRLWLLGVMELLLSVLLTFSAAFFGPVAVAAAALMCIHLMAAFFLHFGKRDFKLRRTDVFLTMRPFIFCASFVGICVFCLNNMFNAALSPTAHLFIGVAFGMLCYPLLLLVFFPCASRDLLDDTAVLAPSWLSFAWRAGDRVIVARLRYRLSASF